MDATDIYVDRPCIAPLTASAEPEADRVQLILSVLHNNTELKVE